MKKYVRYCDTCGEEVDPYKKGSVTLFRDIRIGVGKRYKDVLTTMKYTIRPDDFDGFRKGYSDNNDQEFTFCSVEHCISFLINKQIEVFKELGKK